MIQQVCQRDTWKVLGISSQFHQLRTSILSYRHCFQSWRGGEFHLRGCYQGFNSRANGVNESLGHFSNWSLLPPCGHQGRALCSFSHSYISAKQLPFQQYVALEINFSPLEACLFDLNRFLVSFSGIMQILFICPSSFSTLILFITVPVCGGHVWSARREALELGKEETHFYTWTFPGAAFCSLTLGQLLPPPPAPQVWACCSQVFFLLPRVLCGTEECHEVMTIRKGWGEREIAEEENGRSSYSYPYTPLPRFMAF